MSRRVLALTRYERLGASSRVRFYNHIPKLKDFGFDVVQAPFLTDAYLHSLYSSGRRDPRLILGCYARRLRFLINRCRFDLIWLEKEVLPWMPKWFEMLLLKSGQPMIVDYDDATFHTYDQSPSWLVRLLFSRKIPGLMSHAAVVVAGNRYIADFAAASSALRVEIIPSCVNLNCYGASSRVRQGNEFRIGWIGSPSSLRYLTHVAKPLETFCRNYDARLIIIGMPGMEVPNVPVTVLPWSEEKEGEYLADIDVGIMPLIDEPWANGKCGYKAIQYMAAGKPVIVSPSPANRIIVEDSGAGYLAANDDEWYDVLRMLHEDRSLARRLGAKGRQIAAQRYSVDVVTPEIASIFESVLQNTGLARASCDPETASL